MNKKFVIACLVGGIILFLWQFLSNAAIDIHAANHKYTANQDAIIATLNANLTEDGQYHLPMYAPDASDEVKQKMMEEGHLNPSIQINYHKVYGNTMPMNMIRSVLANIVAVALFVFFVLNQMKVVNLKSTVMLAIGVSLCMYLVTSYGNAIWYKTNSFPDLIDAIVSWGLTGAWLGYYLRRD